MQTFPVDGLKLTILMIAGGVFALAGIWIMLRAKQEGSTARLELFGLKFEASSAGIIVFLIGSVFLAAPMFVPERPPEDPRSTGGTTAKTNSNTPADTPANPEPVGAAPLLPGAIDKEEVEGNDSVRTATILEVGQTASGAGQGGDVDWYAVAVDPKAAKELHFVFRKKGSGCPQLTILDGTEKIAGNKQVCEISGTIDLPIRSDRYFVQVDSGNYDIAYELAVTYKR